MTSHYLSISNIVIFVKLWFLMELFFHKNYNSFQVKEIEPCSCNIIVINNMSVVF